jgi:hypothetical protein
METLDNPGEGKMKRIFLLSSILLLSAVWALAESDGSKITVDGCLMKSSGSFNLLDKATGNTYHLEGDTAKLDEHVGHTVQVTGTINPFGDESIEDLPKDMGGPTESDIVKVHSVENISSSCKDISD